MRKLYWLAPAAVGAAALAAILALRPTATTAQNQKDPAPAASGQTLPINKVILFSSGVGYFERQAAVEGEVLTMRCAEGGRAVKLNEVQRLRFLNPAIEAEFRRALETLALSHDAQKKAVSLNFTGEGKRDVRVGYVVENPIWKTSYRLVLDKDGKPFLQGWAVVDNPTDDDWNNVGMALISGRPISFQMDL